jgi:hypothetical protein
MAELVDALVSNTSSSNAVWVQVPLRVLKKSESESECETKSGAIKFRKAEAIANTLISFSSRLALTLTLFQVAPSDFL